MIDPPWLANLYDALFAAYGHLEHGRSRERADRAIQRARAAGWDGNDSALWQAAKAMANGKGSLAWVAQSGFLSGEAARWRDESDQP
jgi:hypothetical protein